MQVYKEDGFGPEERGARSEDRRSEQEDFAKPCQSIPVIHSHISLDLRDNFHDMKRRRDAFRHMLEEKGILFVEVFFFEVLFIKTHLESFVHRSNVPRIQKHL